jgi:L-rhamnose mutarotase
MRRIAMVIDLKPEHEARYRALHAAPWPGVIAALRAAHVRNYSIFLKDHTLFGYLEYHGEDWEADMATVAADPETQRWWKETDPAQVKWATAGEDEWWAHMEEVFHMD